MEQLPETQPVNWETARRIGLALADMTDATSYGTPSLRLRNTFFARLREDGETMVLKIDDAERDARMQADPETFFITDHYAGGGLLLIRLPRVSEAELTELITLAWQMMATPPRRQRRPA